MYVIWRHLFVATSRHKSTDTAGKQREEFTVPEVSDIVRYYTPLLSKNTDIGWGKRWRSWLRHCATDRKVAVLIPDGVIAIFHWLTFRPLYGPGIDSVSNRNEYQGYLLVGKGGRCVWLTTFPPSLSDCLEILGTSISWSLKSLSRPVMW
jgi:hypothetical protein